MPVTIVHIYLKKQIHLAVVPTNGIYFCESTLLSSPLLLWEVISWLEVEQLVTERVTMGLKAKVMVCLGVRTILCQ